MFAADDPLLPAWRQFKQLFGSQEIVLAAYAEEEGLAPENFARLKELTRELQAAVPGLRVQSLSTTPFGDQILVGEQQAARRLRELLTGYLLSADRTTVAVVCLLPVHPPTTREGEPTAAQRRVADIDALRKVVERYPSGTLAGEPAMIVDGFRFLEQDGLRLERVSTTLVLLTLFLAFSFAAVGRDSAVARPAFAVADTRILGRQRVSTEHGQLDACRDDYDRRRGHDHAPDRAVSSGTRAGQSPGRCARRLGPHPLVADLRRDCDGYDRLRGIDVCPCGPSPRFWLNVGAGVVFWLYLAARWSFRRSLWPARELSPRRIPSHRV